MRSKAAQMLRKASALLTKASREAAKVSSEYAEAYLPGVSSGKLLPKRIKNLHKKALRFEDPLLLKKYAQKGWPRGYEFGTHRMTRKLRPSELFWAESGEGRNASGEDASSSGLAW